MMRCCTCILGFHLHIACAGSYLTCPSPLHLTVVTTLADAQAALRRLAAVLRAAGVGHAGLHDLLLLYASVQRWVGQAEYRSFTAQLANVRRSG